MTGSIYRHSQVRQLPQKAALEAMFAVIDEADTDFTAFAAGSAELFGADGATGTAGVIDTGSLTVGDGGTLTLRLLLDQFFDEAGFDASSLAAMGGDGIGIGNLHLLFAKVAGNTGVKATGTLTLATNVEAGDTVTIGASTSDVADTRVYTFRTQFTGAAYEVLIGSTLAISRDNLMAAINGTASDKYSSNTLAHPLVVATSGSGTLVVTSRYFGPASNLAVTTEVSTHMSWGAATLAGGAGSLLDKAKIMQKSIDPADETLTIWTAVETVYNLQLLAAAESATPRDCPIAFAGTRFTGLGAAVDLVFTLAASDTFQAKLYVQPAKCYVAIVT